MSSLTLDIKILAYAVTAAATLGLGMALSLIFSLTEITVLALSPPGGENYLFFPDLSGN